MKVLFVGEGITDVGNGNDHPDPTKAGGVVGTLAQKLCVSIHDMIAHRWTHLSLLRTEIARIDRKLRSSGYQAKTMSAVIASVKKYQCGGTVCVADGDTAPADCLEQMQAGCRKALDLLNLHRHHFACGVVYQSIEAWTLGVPEAVAAELGVDVGVIQGLLPPKGIEELSEQSGRPEYKPKGILKKIMDLDKRREHLEFVEAVARRTDLAALARVCQKGFAPFARSMEQAFGRLSRQTGGIGGFSRLWGAANLTARDVSLPLNSGKRTA